MMHCHYQIIFLANGISVVYFPFPGRVVWVNAGPEASTAWNLLAEGGRHGLVRTMGTSPCKVRLQGNAAPHRANPQNPEHCQIKSNHKAQAYGKYF